MADPRVRLLVLALTYRLDAERPGPSFIAFQRDYTSWATHCNGPDWPVGSWGSASTAAPADAEAHGHAVGLLERVTVSVHRHWPGHAEGVGAGGCPVDAKSKWQGRDSEARRCLSRLPLRLDFPVAGRIMGHDIGACTQRRSTPYAA